MVHLMNAQANGTTANDYQFVLSAAPEEVVVKVANGEVDVAAVPTNLAAALYAKTSGAVQMLAVNTLGVMSILETDDEIVSMADLKGRTIHLTGQGSNPEYVLRFLLRRNGLDPGADVKLVFSSQHEELATLVATGQVELALLPEPFVTTAQAKNPKARIALDLTKEWAKAVTDGSQLLTGAVIARRDFIARNPDAVTAFLEEYEQSIAAAESEVDATAELCAKFGIIPSAAVAKQAIPRLNLTYLAGAELRAASQGYFQVLYAADARSIGGAIPDAGFYYPAK